MNTMKTIKSNSELKALIQKAAGVIITSSSTKCQGSFECYLTAFPKDAEYNVYVPSKKKYYDHKSVVARSSSFNCDTALSAKSFALARLAKDLGVDTGNIESLLYPDKLSHIFTGV